VPYLEQTDLLELIDEATLISLTDDADDGYVNEEIVAEVLDTAEEEAMGYIANRYSVPLVEVPGVVKKHTVAIAAHALYSRRMDPPDRIVTAHKNAINYFLKVADGKAHIQGATPKTDPATRTSAGRTDGNERLFTRTKLEDA